MVFFRVIIEFCLVTYSSLISFGNSIITFFGFTVNDMLSYCGLPRVNLTLSSGFTLDAPIVGSIFVVLIPFMIGLIIFRFFKSVIF